MTDRPQLVRDDSGAIRLRGEQGEYAKVMGAKLSRRRRWMTIGIAFIVTMMALAIALQVESGGPNGTLSERSSPMNVRLGFWCVMATFSLSLWNFITNRPAIVSAEAIRTLTARNRCPSCYGPLIGADVNGPQMSECPECGAVWRINEDSSA